MTGVVDALTSNAGRKKRIIPEIIPEEDFVCEFCTDRRKENYEERGGGNKDVINGIECEFISQNDKEDKEKGEEDNGKDEEDHDKRNMENKNKETEEEIKEVTNPHKENTKEDKKNIGDVEIRPIKTLKT